MNAPAADHTSDLGRKKLYFPALDGLRGLAVLAVVVGHFTVDLYDRSGRLMKALLVVPHFGILGVQLFFVLSGFLVSLPFWHEKEAGRWLPPGYAAKRFIRIVPCFYFSAVALALLDWGFHAGDGRYIVSALRWMAGWNSYLAGYRLDPVNFNSVYWTLILEIVFYILLPFFFLALRSFRSGAASLLLSVFLLAMGIGSRAWVVHAAPPETAAGEMDNLLRGYFGYIDLFAFGIFLAWAYRQPALLKRMKALSVPLLLAVVLALAFGAYIAAGTDAGAAASFNALRSTSKYYFAGLFSAVLVLVEFQPGTFLNRVFTSRWIVYLGIVSYEWYLVHVPFLHLGMELGGSLAGPVRFVVTSAVPMASSLGAAMALHHFFYVPVSRWLRGRMLPQRPGVPIVADR